MKTIEVFEKLQKMGAVNFEDNPGQLWCVLKGLMGDKAIEFDLECIESDKSYRTVFSRYKDSFYGECKIRYQHILSFYDIENQKAGISINVGGQELNSEWEQSSDWVADEFFTFIEEKLEPLLEGKFVVFCPVDQFYRALYVPKNIANEVDALFRSYESV